MGWMLALAMFATYMCTDIELIPEKKKLKKQERERAAAKTDPVDCNDRPKLTADYVAKKFAPRWGE